MHLHTLLLILLILPLSAQAATVWLSNGDRLSGDIIALDGGKLALKTRYAGQVLIDWKDIDTLSSEAPLLIRRDGLDSEYSQQLAAAGTGMVRVVGDDTQTVPLASITRLVPPRPLFKDRVWQGNLDAKVDIKREQDSTEEWKLKGDTRLEHGRWRHLLSGESERESKDGKQTEDTWRLEYDLDRFFTRHWFWRAGVEQHNDRLAVITQQRLAGTGPGYRFWDDELGRFDLIGQLNRVYFTSDQGDLAFNTLSLQWDYKRLLSGTRLELYSLGEIQVPHIPQIDYVLDSEYGVRYRLNNWVRLSLLYELDQLRGLGQVASTQHYLLGVGVGW
ncbi:MAG: DUF481 domain-containing protein [Gammaproteobacteria bacterium]|nr:DUF481 domain-containing protein [Gammaproteobacteria bacterium]MBU1491276.1 DUF481 domain-containing protein [Gammaproteobacteria bacterium]MBU2066603.1 DUF481 domain-containing protein [Gammaproteobacteria bacterium]MBU2140646.1 DUF481 domain-containing protein [Gammaproteobacteria bacterium]MBU2218636.1 DUF481 domain-containing protein [Gammaproteobacteria bacterium]